MNLENELIRTNKQHTESNEIKKDILLLEETTQQERSVLREAGLSGMFDKIGKQEAVRLTRIKKQEEFNTKLYILEEIKELCIKYRLRFLHSKEFHGKIDPKLGKKLVEYLKERKVVGSIEGEANTNLFILAKKRDFNFEQKENLKDVNPILFYQVDTNEGKMYSVITKWGRSFGIERIVLGYMYKSILNYILSYIIGVSILTNIIISFFGISPIFYGNLLGSIGAGLLTLLILAISYDFYFDKKRLRKLTTNINWNLTKYNYENY